MSKMIDLNPDSLNVICKIDERLVFYNIEMTEVTGGSSGKPTHPDRLPGQREFPLLTATGLKDIMAMVSVAALAIKEACSVRKENELFL